MKVIKVRILSCQQLGLQFLSLVFRTPVWYFNDTLVSVAMESRGQEKTAIFASFTLVMFPSTSRLKTMPWITSEL